MAKRRMFSAELMKCDKFMELPAGSRLFYVYLNLCADDDGLYGGKKSLLRLLGLTQEDFEPLVREGFVHEFESGVLAVMHWKLHNQIKKDRYTSSVYVEEKARLTFVPGKGYVLSDATAADNAEGARETPDAPAEETALPLRDGSEYTPPEERLTEYRRLYPDVDVAQQLRNMRGWLLTNPKKQKDADSIERFMGAWLLNAQNGAVSPGNGALYEKDALTPRGTPKARGTAGPASYDIIAAQKKMDATVPVLKKRPR